MVETNPQLAALEETRRRHEATIETNAAVIADLETVVDDRQHVIEELNAANSRLQEACEERLSLIDEQNATILSLQADLHLAGSFAGLAKLQEEHRQIVDELTVINARLQTICDEREALLESQSQTIAILNEECNQRDAEIARLHKTAVERLTVIEALNDALERLPG